MNKQTMPSTKAHLLRSASILLSLIAVCAIPFALGQRTVRDRASLQARTLTFAERVAYQHAIEDVYWRHRIWPRGSGERPDPKPSLDGVISQVQLEKKVADYLRNAQALEDYWQSPISAEQLQAEMDRMAQHTKQPEVLRELFEALGNDPVVIAECLARPVLAERSLANSDGNVTEPSDASRARAEKRMPKKVAAIDSIAKAVQVNRPYQLPIIASPSGDCTDDTWIATSTTNAPSARRNHTAVWTGSEMIVWGGTDGVVGFNTGGRYTPSTDSWSATSTVNAPAGRDAPAIWTGTEMIVWGGTLDTTGGRYNPITDSWIATSTTNAPAARVFHTAIWTGSEMIVWGGFAGNSELNTGGRYNPGTDSWTGTSTANAPAAREFHSAIWTGNEMIVWGGRHQFVPLNTGGRYNPGSNSWVSTNTVNAPSARVGHTGVWSGTEMEMIVWGGTNVLNNFNTGGRYNPGTDSWIATTTTDAPTARFSHTAVWTNSNMIVWGGSGGSLLNTGGRYDPSRDSWTATTITNAPEARWFHTAIWSDSEMIVWGGSNDGSLINTGGRYCAQSGPTPTPTATATATPTPIVTPTTTPTATPTPCTGRCAPTPRPRPTPAPRP